jgi:hypothetical protein
MNLNKLYGYLTPDTNLKFNIIGCGAIGSTIAENLIRLGYTKFTLFDFDIVSPHNITNQNFISEDIGKNKTESLKNYLLQINPEADIIVKEKYTKQNLSGVVILAVDNIETRKNIITTNLGNPNVKYWLDFRMGLTEAQNYFISNQLREKEWLLKTMDFSHEEAIANTPVSPCGTTLNVVTTVKTICALGTQNLINAELNKDTKNLILINLDVFNITTANISYN